MKEQLAVCGTCHEEIEQGSTHDPDNGDRMICPACVENREAEEAEHAAEEAA